MTSSAVAAFGIAAASIALKSFRERFYSSAYKQEEARKKRLESCRPCRDSDRKSRESGRISAFRRVSLQSQSPLQTRQRVRRLAKFEARRILNESRTRRIGSQRDSRQEDRRENQNRHLFCARNRAGKLVISLTGLLLLRGELDAR